MKDLVEKRIVFRPPKHCLGGFRKIAVRLVVLLLVPRRLIAGY